MTRYAPVATSAAAAATNGPKREATSGGRTARATIASHSAQRGASRSGNPASAVAIEAARISGPDISFPAGVVCASATVCAYAPLTPINAILPRTAAAENLPRSTSARLRCRIVPAGPG